MPPFLKDRAPGLALASSVRYTGIVKESVRVARPPVHPVLIFDGECEFCRRWVNRWQRATCSQIKYLPLQDACVGTWFPEIPRAQLEASVHLVEPDGLVSIGAEAVFRSFRCAGKRNWPLRLYNDLPPFAWLAEHAYRFVARHRGTFSALARRL